MIKLIIPTGNWPGLAETIQSSGYSFECLDNEYYSDNGSAQTLINNYTMQKALDFAKLNKSYEVSTISRLMREKATPNIASGEMASWPVKLAEAQKFTETGVVEDAPRLGLEASTRGVSLQDMVTRVLGNASRLATLEAIIGGIDGKHRDAIDALTTIEDVNSYDITAYWPVI